MQNIVATYDLPVEDAEAPALPDGMDRDPVQFREDLSDAADPFGFVTLRVDIPSSEGLSKADLTDWLVSTLACNPLAVGRIVQSESHLDLGMHSSVAAKAMKALGKEGVAGSTRTTELLVL
jgi:hypothetical protein